MVKRRLWTSLLLTFLIASASAAAPKVGDDPPDVFGKSSTGEAVHLSDYRGRIVIIYGEQEIPILIDEINSAWDETAPDTHSPN